MKTATPFLLIGAIAAAVACWALLYRVGVSRDSISYLHYSRILLGKEPIYTALGAQSSISHYPPIYPMMLAIAGALHANALHAAQAINVVCFALSAMVFACIVWRYTKSRVRLVLSAVLFMTQPAVTSVHLWMASEPPFLLATLLIFLAMAGYLNSDDTQRPKRAMVVGLLIAAAMMTRYIGLPWAAAVCLTIGMTHGWKSRWRDLVTLVAVSVGPLLVLSIVHKIIGTSVAHRTLNYHPITNAQWSNLLDTLIGWIASPKVSSKALADWVWIIAATSAGFVVAMLIVGRRQTSAARIVLPMIVCYVGMLLVSVLLVDNSTQLDDRLLSPVALLLSAWVLIEMPSLSRFKRMPVRAAYVVFTGLLVLTIVGNGAARSYGVVRELRSAGLGFDHVVFKRSPLVRACRKLPADAVIYSNYPEAILLHAGRNAWILPGHPKLQPGEVAPMADDVSSVQRMLQAGGYVAYFKFRAGRTSAGVAMTLDEVNAITPFTTVRRVKDGVLLKAVDAAK